MKNLILFACILFTGILIFACQPDQKATVEVKDDNMAAEKPAMTKEDSVRRGEYLVTLMGCHDCHSPKIMTAQGPAPDPARAFSGHPAAEVLPPITDRSMMAPGQWIFLNSGITAFVGPWGTSFAANLTPHESGIGNWTFENFKRALKEGKLKGQESGRMLLPPMPWPNFRNATDEDLGVMWQYFRSLPPIDNVVPAALPPS